MKLNLITFASSLASRESIFTDHHELLDAIAERYDVRYIFPEELGDKPAEGATMVLVGSGGVEEMVKADIDRLPPYVVLIADGLKNSLAASLEILSWMRQAGRHGRVLHGPNEFIMRGINDYATAHNAISKLSGKRVGVIGKPSGWLIASNVDYQAMRERWGIEMVDVPLDEVVKGYEAVPDDEVQTITDDFINRAVGILEPSRDEVVKAMRLYRSIKNLVEHYRLDAFTLNCFDLIPTTHTTGCVALALLNQEGIPAGCEGDEQTTQRCSRRGHLRPDGHDGGQVWRQWHGTLLHQPSTTAGMHHQSQHVPHPAAPASGRVAGLLPGAQHQQPPRHRPRRPHRPPLSRPAHARRIPRLDFNYELHEMVFASLTPTLSR